MSRWLGCLLCLLSGVVVMAADSTKPGLQHTLFDNLPSKMFYFDDSQVVLYHDSIGKNVLRSDDEGKSWAKLAGVPESEAIQLIEHPYDVKTAFVLTKGKTHYRSIDRGKTWASFETELPPAIGPNTLAFHSDKQKWDWILFTATKCEGSVWGSKVCHDETYYTQDAFATSPRPLMSFTSRCMFAQEKPEFARDAPPSLIYCAAFEPPSERSSSSKLSSLFGGGMRSLSESRLYSSTDFFKKDRTFVDLGIGREAKGVVGIGGIQKYIVCALKPGIEGEMVLYVSTDGSHWSRAVFPHGQGLKENAYTIVESTGHSILVDVSSADNGVGTLFTSNSNGTYFVKSEDNTNRNKAGIVDFEKLVGIEGVALMNTVDNPAGVLNGDLKIVKTKITFDDGGRWQLIPAPSKDHKGKDVHCDTSSLSSCSLHLHNVVQPHNSGKVFSSTAPGLVMGVGSIGDRLLDYDECDTFLSTDGGVSWRMVEDGAHKYEFGDQGSLLLMIEDEEPTDELKYSWDMGKTWHEVKLGVHMRARLLTTVPDSTSLKFILLGTLTRGSKEKGSNGERHIIIHLDFADMGKRKCSDSDFEKWYARKIGPKGDADCLMGHKQWFMRRKQDADCVVAEKFKDPVGREENCPCDDEDYECDFNFAPEGDQCIPVGPEPVPVGACLSETDKFKGSSGFRLIPGNTCDQRKGIKKDALVEKPCHAAKENPGLVSHQVFEFPGVVLTQEYFDESKTIVAFTTNNKVWQSNNEGYSWNTVANGEYIVAMTMHQYARDRAYLITESRKVHYTTDKGLNWYTFTAPADPNSLGVPLLDFHPIHSDWLIWTGQKDCDDSASNKCRAVAYYTKNNGRKWEQVDEYVRVCTWGRDKKLRIDEKIIFCESYRDKKGSQRAVYNNPLELVAGEYFYTQRKTLFKDIVGFATFEEYMVVAELYDKTHAIGFHVSVDGKTFALSQFPPNTEVKNEAYTVLESTTDAIFLHVTTHSDAGSEWGTIFKSNSNGTYYALSLEHANRDTRGFVDFEKMIGLDGIALVNVVTNPQEAALSGNKKYQTRITHNDGGRWKPLVPPVKDSLGNSYPCTGTNCALHVHGYTERRDPRATFSSPSAVGLMMAVGNVGETLAPYVDSDTFLTRDGGFTWEEVHKDAHMWEYGDQGSILVLVNDEGATSSVTYTLDEGLTWNDYDFGQRIRARSIVTVPADTSRKFILFGEDPSKPDSSVAVHLDFSQITNRKCKLDLSRPDDDDFELWSPSEEREEKCLFGQQIQYHRRIRDRQCYIGDRLPKQAKIVKTCPCTEDDFECEFNHRRDERGRCVLVEGASPLANDDTCAWDEPFWFERTNMRKVPHSKCEGGLALDRGSAHACPGAGRHGWLFWLSITIAPFFIAALAAVWWTRRRSPLFGSSKGRIRLPEPGESGASGPTKALEVLVSVPYFVIGLAGVAAAKMRDVEIPFVSAWLRRRQTRGGYRHLSFDDDAPVLLAYDDSDEE